MFFRQKSKNEVNSAFLGIMSDLGLGSRSEKAVEEPLAEPQRNLSDIFADLEASDRRLHERRQGGDRRSSQDRRESGAGGEQAGIVQSSVPIEDAPPVERAVAEDVAPSHDAEMPEVPANEQPTEQPQVEPGPVNGRASVADDVALPEFDEAQRRAAAHRQALQAMLDEAHRVEQQIAAEANEARAAAIGLNLEKKQEAAARAVELEKQAITRAAELGQQSDRAAEDQERATSALQSVRAVTAEALNRVAECEERLREARQVAAEASGKEREREEQATNSAQAAEKARRDAQEAHLYAAKCREMREASEMEAFEAQRIASGLTPSNTASERLRALEQRARPS